MHAMLICGTQIIRIVFHHDNLWAFFPLRLEHIYGEIAKFHCLYGHILTSLLPRVRSSRCLHRSSSHAGRSSNVAREMAGMRFYPRPSSSLQRGVRYVSRPVLRFQFQFQYGAAGAGFHSRFPFCPRPKIRYLTRHTFPDVRRAS